MKRVFPILTAVCLGFSVPAQNQSAQNPSVQMPQTAAQAAGSSAAGLIDKEAQDNARQARAIVDQAIQALGGPDYLHVRDRETQGRGYRLHHGQPSGGGALFWSFSEFPDKERVEITKQRDIAELYVGNRGWEITYKGAHPIEEKDLTDYLRLKRFGIETVLRTWVNDPGVVFLYEGNAIAAQHSAVKVELINAKNESVALFFDVDTHLPVKKTFEWRDPVDKQKNLEEEIYENYRQVSGVMIPYNVTRYFNGDMAAERFLSGAAINQGLDESMFDPNSGYNPNKPAKKR